MDPGTNSQSNSNSQDPYLILGINEGASFDAIQEARDNKLIEAGDDQITKAKVEAAYDSLLMVSLKSRQLGNASNEAITASKKENEAKKVGDIGPGSLLTRLKNLNLPKYEASKSNFLPSFELPSGQELNIRISLGILAFLLVLIVPSESVELILSFSTIGLFISQSRRGRPFFSSVLWCILLLSIGLLSGALLLGGAQSFIDNTGSLSSDKFEAIPAVFLLWLGVIFLD
ncbi:CPP1-like family protein [Prochlorococcus marinus]|uniref:CPP1-like family protein n=1 Tax=Prochlorococcus marinus TaxID=1219 RepID=UPI0022B336E3|nr:CPP1-like family protein [Prochlorococcus marinus]